MKVYKRLSAIIMVLSVLMVTACSGPLQKWLPKEKESCSDEETIKTDEAEQLEDPVADTMASEPEAKTEGAVLLDLSFDDGSTEGFNTYIEGGNATLSNENGEMVVTIGTCGSVSYANQVYRDGFSLEKGCRYVISFDIRSEVDRGMEYRLQLNGGDYHAYFEKKINLKTETIHVEKEFLMEEDTDNAPRLCFNLGSYNGMQSDPGNHKVIIDNVRLVNLDGEGTVNESTVSESISINQVGYKPDDLKTVVAAGIFSGSSFEVKNKEDDSVAFSGTLGNSMSDAATGTEVCHGDFSALVDEGSFYIEIASEKSGIFSIGENVYEELFAESLKMLFMQRCGMELTDDLAGDYAHPACHTEIALIYGTNAAKDVNGGWHDAGDYGRYTVPAAKTVADLLLTYESGKNNSIISSDSIGIAESGNGIPDILDEARYELEWLLKMQDYETGGVYHKVSGYNFPGTVMPQDEVSELVIAPISTAATADFAAIMAKAAVDYNDVDKNFSNTCIAAAKDAWAYLQKNTNYTGFTNPDGIVTGEYADGNVTDEIYWAACELYLAGRTLGVKTVDASEIPELYSGVDLGWAAVGAYGMYDLAIGAPELEQAKSAKNIILQKAEEYKSLSEKDGYFTTLGTDYYWGSNGVVANHGMIMLMADRLSGSAMYNIYAKKQLDYLLGVNGTGYCYVTGFGYRATSDPHHRPSQSVGKAIKGMLAGGPDSYMDDAYAAQVLQGLAPGLCYVDNQRSYSTNEVAIGWNSPLIYLTGSLQ